jgi:transcription elongation GreA/GreB family factor
MNDVRFLTSEEAVLLSDAAENWMRLRDVELNPGEYLLQLLSGATVRPRKCAREDIASLNWTMAVELPGYGEPKELTLVSPKDADISFGRVSVLSLLGLSFIGRVVGSVAQIELASGLSKKASLLAARRCAALA